MEKIIQILQYRGRQDLAKLLKRSHYQIAESSTYGSYLFSILSTVEIFSPLDINEKLNALSESDVKIIFNAFLTVYPPSENAPELVNIRFYLDPDAEMVPLPQKHVHLSEVDFDYIQEQLEKCDEKINSKDYDGAITNARTLVENVCYYILDKSGVEYETDGDLPKLYKQVSKVIKTNPEAYIEGSFKQTLSGVISIIQGLSSIRNTLGDAHGKPQSKHYRPLKRHALLVVNIAKAISEYLLSSFLEQKRND
jgi:hypothetical protein